MVKFFFFIVGVGGVVLCGKEVAEIRLGCSVGF